MNMRLIHMIVMTPFKQYGEWIDEKKRKRHYNQLVGWHMYKQLMKNRVRESRERPLTGAAVRQPSGEAAPHISLPVLLHQFGLLQDVLPFLVLL